MGIGQWVAVYVASLAVFLAIDLVWLGKIARGFYRRQLADLMLEKLKWQPALGFYLLYVFGLLVLVVAPAVEAGSALKAGGLGALLGCVSYATYDLSNLATLKKWPAAVVAADIVWGALLTGAVSLIAYAAARAVAG
jgi:uncharacterized membrane protein